MKKLIVILLALLPLFAMAQRENADIRAGNTAWGRGDYKSAEIAYRNALQINGESTAALSNLASSLHRQNQDSIAIGLWQKIASNKELSQGELSAASYNAATAMLKAHKADPSKLDAAIEGFKESLRRNPNDRDAKYNLAYAQKLKQDGDGGGGGDDQKKNQENQDQNKDQQNQDQKDKNQDQKDQKDQDEKQDEQSQAQPEKPKSRADAERMADAIQRAENQTKEKVDKEKKEKAIVGVGGKSW